MSIKQIDQTIIKLINDDDRVLKGFSSNMHKIHELDSRQTHEYERLFAALNYCKMSSERMTRIGDYVNETEKQLQQLNQKRQDLAYQFQNKILANIQTQLDEITEKKLAIIEEERDFEELKNKKHQIQDEEIMKNFKLDEDTFKKLHQQFTKIYDLEYKSWIEYDGLCKVITHMYHLERDRIPKLAHVIQMVEESIKSTSIKREKYAQFIKQSLIPSINGQLQQITNLIAILIDFRNKRQIEEQKQEKMKKNKDESLQKELFRQYQDALKEKNQAITTFQNSFAIYINERNEELRAMYQHLVNKWMVSSALGIQEYSIVARELGFANFKHDADQYIISMLGIQRHK